jgi:hypothetical protein
VWQRVNPIRHPSHGPAACTLGLRRSHASKSSLPQPDTFSHSVCSASVGGTGTSFTFARIALSYSRPAVAQFTQETAEPLRFSPAEPVD